MCIFGAVCCGALITNILLKDNVARLRPFEASYEYAEWWFNVGSPTEDGFSFPSGHVTACAAGMTAITLMRGKKWLVPSVIIVLIMGISRNYLMAHYPSDVLFAATDYLDQLDDGKILFGWAHAAQGLDFTSKCLEKNFTVIAWEEIFEDGRYIFYRNREIAGEAAVMHAFCNYGKMPYDCKVAIVGNGQTAKGAMRILHGLGATVDVYGRKQEQLFRKKLYEYDVIINCVMWDISRKDHLIYKDDLAKMQPNSMIVDVSCDPYLGVETSHPTTISDPVYEVDGVLHYAVDNTPAMFPFTVTKVLSEGTVRMMDDVIEGTYPPALLDAMVIEQGHIRSKSVWDFREARGLLCK